ncbi:hypothetical protein H5410_004852 [Solanum commersonii]|uniref:Uncharacterized protein n=1 Tax=Solanum commersonii TaxID=4109 RepID=A0A9J6A5I1_SOLCO|nr:hypothetical protein H5410_004852 [Solanum commersonii]
MVSLEGLDEVKSNLEELEEVDEIAGAGVAGPVTDHKKGAPHREGCYICGETSHAACYCPSLSKLSAMVVAQKQQEQASAQTGGPPEEQCGHAGGADKGKNVAVGMFNHMALFNHMTLAALAAQPASIRPCKSLFVNAKLNDKNVRIMIDTGATHNFVTKERAKDLCLNYVSSDTMLKTFNALPTTVHGFTPKVCGTGAVAKSGGGACTAP